MCISKVVSRDFVSDFIASLQNTFGGNLSPYEKMLDKATTSIWKEVETKNLKMKTYGFAITQLGDNAVAVLFYGDTE